MRVVVVEEDVEDQEDQEDEEEDEEEDQDARRTKRDEEGCCGRQREVVAVAREGGAEGEG